MVELGFFNEEVVSRYKKLEKGEKLLNVFLDVMDEKEGNWFGDVIVLLFIWCNGVNWYLNSG